MCSHRIICPNFLLKATRAMSHFTTHPYHSINDVFVDMRMKRTNSSWSFNNDQERKYIPQAFLRNSSISKLHEPGYRAPLMICKNVCMWREKIAYPTPYLQNNQKIPIHIYSMSSILGFNILTVIIKHIKHTNIHNNNI